jgi:hypothetical protein
MLGMVIGTLTHGRPSLVRGTAPGYRIPPPAEATLLRCRQCGEFVPHNGQQAHLSISPTFGHRNR